jgi:hypothetical protein
MLASDAPGGITGTWSGEISASPSRVRSVTSFAARFSMLTKTVCVLAPTAPMRGTASRRSGGISVRQRTSNEAISAAGEWKLTVHTSRPSGVSPVRRAGPRRPSPSTRSSSRSSRGALNWKSRTGLPSML